MILVLTGAREAAFLALILEAASEGKPVSELAGKFIGESHLAELVREIGAFAKSELSHPLLNLAREQMAELFILWEEEKRRTHGGERRKEEESEP
jgi:hypothetical protein